jgi:hypothetical protein
MKRALALLIGLAACGAPEPAMDELAERYVRLVLAVGEHDPDYVDAYYGPERWRLEVSAESLGLQELGDRAALLAEALGPPAPRDRATGGDSPGALRHRFLSRQLRAVAFRIAMLRGEFAGFDEEAQALYDVSVPRYGTGHFDSIIRRLDAALPRGSGTVGERLERYRRGFVIPPSRLDTVFRRAIEACRERTARWISLPEGESFTVAYVTDKPWSGYNWYQGSYASRIEVNTDLPIHIDRAVDLACHEGYPGHHLYNAMLERALVRGRGWAEYSVYPLFSPQSLIAEGSANYGITMAFPGEERVAFERDSLFPLAGLDRRRAAEYYRIQDLAAGLTYAGNEAARGYVDGTLSLEETAAWLERWALMSPERARQRSRFIDRYRSYVINYNLGRDIVAAWVEGAGGDAAARWGAFATLLSSPMVPSGMR